MITIFKKMAVVLLIFSLITLLPINHVAIAKTINTSTTINLTDYSETNITLKKPATRIVALAPHIVENIFTVGLGSHLVGVVSHSDYPEAAQKINVVGHYNGYSLEKIIALQPDIVFIWASSNKHNIAEKLRRLNIPVYIDNPKTLYDIQKSLNDIARIGGIDISHNQTINDFNKRIFQLEKTFQKSQKKTTERVNVFFQISQNPLQTLNGDHIASNIIELCGGINIYKSEPSIAPIVNIESLLQRNPDIIITGSNYAEINSKKNEANSLDSWRKYPNVNAVKRDAFLHVPADWIYRHTVRITKAADMMCNAIKQASLH